MKEKDTGSKREISLKKAEKFRQYALEYIDAKNDVPIGFKLAAVYAERKERIKDALGASEEDWQDWKWQMANRISNVEKLEKLFTLSEKQKQDFMTIQSKFRWAFTPYFASLMDPLDEKCPVRKQMLPDIREMAMTGVADFSGEEYSSPVENLVRWYPDRVAVHVTNVCAGFCRHCLRRRNIGEVDRATSEENLGEILQYLRDNREIRDVLLTGGDPFTFSTGQLDQILTALDEIEHIEIKRIGSRVPIVLPQRIDEELCEMLSRHHPLFVNVQVNHPKELTNDSKGALDLLSRAGIPLHNQSVLLKGINDSPVTIKALNHELLKVRVRPYYLYHCQGTIGIEHFRTPIETGIEILENLRGFTTGLAVPSYIITPSGYGKTPLAPSYQFSSGDGFVLLRNWEGTIYRYDNPRPVEEE
ncbi:MAG: KamA family radical SAM protein [Bacillota bacterium]